MGGHWRRILACHIHDISMQRRTEFFQIENCPTDCVSFCYFVMFCLKKCFIFTPNRLWRHSCRIWDLEKAKSVTICGRIWEGVQYTNRSPADEASRTQNSANRASPKGAPDWLSFEYGELHLPDFLCVLWARTHFSDSEKLLQLIRHTMWRRSVSSCINKKIITDIVVYYFVHYERQASTKDLCFHVCCFFGIGIE